MVTKKIFLASSSELEADRKAFEILINRKNKDWVKRGIFLELILWEDFLDAVSQTRLQDDYNRAVRESDIFVMLFFTKVGKYTEEEFETAFGQFKAVNKPFIFTYFKDAQINMGSINEDVISLLNFRKKLKDLGHFQTIYKNIHDLQLHFSQQLDKLKLIPDPILENHKEEKKEEPIIDENGDPVCPYQGLLTFTQKEHQFFFGRQQVVEDLERMLRRQNFVSLVGASGSGKSSVVLAGLIPQLKKLEWQVLGSIRLGSKPLDSLKKLLKNHFPEQLVDHCITPAGEGWKPLLEWLLSEQKEEPTGKSLLVIDPFEDLFTSDDPEKQRDCFIKLIAQVAGFPYSPLAVVTTMRADFMADFIEHCLRYESLKQVIQDKLLLLSSLQGLDLMRAITEPARRQGYTITDKLLNKIIEDVQGEPGFLPLLEFVLKYLWEEHDKAAKELTQEEYEKLGGLKSALTTYANKVYNYKDHNKKFPVRERDESEKEQIKRIFLQLLRIGEGGKDTHQRRLKRDILSLAKDSNERKSLEQLIKELVNARLLVIGGKEGWVDLPHGALIEGWEKLNTWRKESRDTRRIVELFENNFKQWKENEKTSGHLLEGSLREAVRARQQAVKDFVGRSSEKWDFCKRSFEVYSSTTKINYKPLATDLEEKNWKAAHEKTVRFMLTAAKRETENYLDSFDAEILPPEDLHLIDQLWLRYSGGKFGFSVQKKIYQNLGGTQNYNEKVWTDFCDQVGWRQDGSWLYHSDLIPDNLDEMVLRVQWLAKVPKGYLPAAARLVWHEGWWCALCCHDLFSRRI